MGNVLPDAGWAGVRDVSMRTAGQKGPHADGREPRPFLQLLSARDVKDAGWAGPRDVSVRTAEQKGPPADVRESRPFLQCLSVLNVKGVGISPAATLSLHLPGRQRQPANRWPRRSPTDACGHDFQLLTSWSWSLVLATSSGRSGLGLGPWPWCGLSRPSVRGRQPATRLSLSFARLTCRGQRDGEEP